MSNTDSQRLDAMRRQRDGYRNQLRKTEQQIQRVREVLEYRKAELQANSKPKQNFEVVNSLGILRAHQRSFRNGRCSCEEYGPKRTFEEHDEHVAEVLDKHMQERIDEAVIQELESR